MNMNDSTNGGINKSTTMAVANRLGFKNQKDTVKPSQIKSKTQQLAYELLLQEEDKAKKSRLGCLLIQQYTNRYGTKQANSQINSFIKGTVQDYLGKHQDLRTAESNLDSLESQIREIVETMKIQVRARTNSRKLDSGKSNVQFEEEKDRHGNDNRSNTQTRREIEDPNQWVVVNAILALKQEKEEEEKQRKIREKAAKYKHELDMQKEEQRKKINDGDDDKIKDAISNERDFKSNEDHKAAMAAKKFNGQATQLDIINSQVEKRREIREREKYTNLAQECLDLERTKQGIKEDNEKKLKKREAQRLAQEAVMAENVKNNAVKAQAAQVQAEYDAKLNLEYQAKLLREEQKREDAKKARVDALKAFEKSYESKVGSFIIAGKQKEADMISNAMDLKMRAEDEKNRLKEEKRREETNRSTNFNKMLMQKKEEQKQKLKDEDNERRLKFERENAELADLKIQQHQAKLAKINKVKSMLDDQVQAKQTREKIGLSEIERELNRGLIKKMTDDSDFYNQVVSKVKPEPIMGNGGGFKFA